MMSETSSDSSDEEVLEIVALERIRNFTTRNRAFEECSEKTFRQLYHLSKDTVKHLIELIKEEICCATFRNRPLSPKEQLLIALRYYATGSFQTSIGDDAKVHKSTVCRVLKKVTHALAKLAPEYIKMPTSHEDIKEIKYDFYKIKGFPNVLGCIDGCHIQILSPGGDNAKVYRNKDGVYSTHVQCVCDAKLRIRDIDVGSPGSLNATTIFNDSQLCAYLKAQKFPNSYLLGDSTYMASDYILTPLSNPVSPSEHKFNASHIATLNTIERTLGAWRRRFGCLTVCMRTNLKELTHPIIIATAVLHNIAINVNDVEDFEDELVENRADTEGIFGGDLQDGNAIRKALIDDFFK